jgi:hypothetical protein
MVIRCHNNNRKMATTSTNDMPGPGTRYECLLTLIDKALGQSRKSFDTAQAVEDCYGEDASMFEPATASRGESKDENDTTNSRRKSEIGSSNVNLLISVIDNMVDRVNERVKEEMVQWLQDHKVGDKLTLIEMIVARLDEEDAEAAQAELDDRHSARLALEAVKLPKGVTPSDILRYHAFQVMEKERDALIHELNKVDVEIQALELQKSKTSSKVEDQIQQMERVDKELERVANLCTMGT